MKPLFDELQAEDIESLAELHVRCLPHTAISQLGHRYATRFYDYIADSPTEHTFVHRDAGDGQIDAVCILSLEPGSLARRLWLSTPLLRGLFGHLLQPTLCGITRALSPWPGRHFDAPEVTSILTAPHRRRHGLGTGLLRRCEQFLVASGFRRYTVRTAAVETNCGRDFFARVGFDSRQSVTNGIETLEKRLPSEPAPCRAPASVQGAVRKSY